MITIKILNSLRDDIFKTFKSDSLKVYTLIGSLSDNPNKGSAIGHVVPICIRELRLDSFRFYFIVNGHELTLFNKKHIKDLLIKFIRMSKKNDQQKTIDEIKVVLVKLGFDSVE